MNQDNTEKKKKIIKEIISSLMNVLTKAHHFKNHKTSTREQVLKFLGKKKRSHIRISVLRHLVLAHGLTSKKKKKKNSLQNQRKAVTQVFAEK